MADSLIIPRRFRGPPESGNGGYSCGVLAAFVSGDAEVTLRSPPPLDRAIDVARIGEAVQATVDGRLVAEARPAPMALEPPPAVAFEEAEQATLRFPWREGHLYPMCFVCGPERAPGDGLCISPGAVEGRGVAAAPFVPDRSVVDDRGEVRPEIVWAALDCPSWFGFHCFNPFDGGVLLGRLAAHVEARPRLGDRCVAVGWSLGRDGRKIRCGSALYSERGALLALGQATWIAVG